MRTVLLQHAYPNSPFLPAMEAAKPWHQAYCDRWNIEYRPLVCDVPNYPLSSGGWAKIVLIRDLLQEGAQVAYVDLDALIVKPGVDLREAFLAPISAVKHPANNECPFDYFNVGVMFLKPDAETFAFIAEWLTLYPGYNHWKENQIFIDLAQRSTKWAGVVTALHPRWNATKGLYDGKDAIIRAWHGGWSPAMKNKWLLEELKRCSTTASRSLTS